MDHDEYAQILRDVTVEIACVEFLFEQLVLVEGNWCF